MLALTITLLLLANPPSPPVDASHLAVGGVEIGIVRSQVIAKLGTPQRIVKGHDDEMGTGDWEELHYSGLVVEVIQPDHGASKHQPHEAYVSRIVLTGRTWVTANGLRLGMSPRQTQSILGRPESTESKNRQLKHWYLTARLDGRVVLRFRNERLVELTIEEDWT